MRDKELFIFDFDGTLFDSHKGIINGVIHAANWFEIPIPNDDVLKSFIGPPLGRSFRENFGLSHEDSMLAIKKLREYYGDKGIFESEPYEGVYGMLQSLLRGKKQLAIATAKPTIYANKILEKHGWSELFTSVQGSSLQGELYPKARTIRSVLEELPYVQHEKAVMIGDTIYDIKGAQEVGLDSIAVEYGYGKSQDLKDARPNFIVPDVSTLHNTLI